MRALKATLLECGIVQRVHGNIKRLPHNTLSFDGTQRVVAFITFYAEEHAILLPGRVPGYKHADIQLLLTHTTKKNVWRQYRASGNGDGVLYCTFCRLWNRLLSAHPHHQADVVCRVVNVSEHVFIAVCIQLQGFSCRMLYTNIVCHLS